MEFRGVRRPKDKGSKIYFMMFVQYTPTINDSQNGITALIEKSIGLWEQLSDVRYPISITIESNKRVTIPSWWLVISCRVATADRSNLGQTSCPANRTSSSAALLHLSPPNSILNPTLRNATPGPYRFNRDRQIHRILYPLPSAVLAPHHRR